MVTTKLVNQPCSEAPHPGKLRLFFAASLPGRVRDELSPIAQALAAASDGGARLLDSAAWHVTLKFLGRTEPDRFAGVVRLLHASAAGIALVPSSPLALTAFPSPRRASVVVVRLADPTGDLARVAERLELGARALGFGAETRRYNPHVTLMRLPAPRDVRAWLDGAPALRNVSFLFDAVRLYRSQLSPKGSTYEVLQTAPLTANRDPPGDVGRVNDDE